ncbi:MAG: response regulator transcription factor [Proteobacteria bacterium]|nr:response regulator transcription factor [Pseudomonadota bacterium]
MKTRILLADDHAAIRGGLKEYCVRVLGLRVVGEAGDSDTASVLVRVCPAGLLVLDLALPPEGGLSVLKAMRAARIALPVLVYTMYPAEQFAAAARAAGAQAYVTKGAPMSEFGEAVRRVLDGDSVFPTLPLRQRGRPPVELSPREQAVMAGILDGEPLVQIARRLGVNASTVTTYRQRLLDKLNVRTNAELAQLVASLGDPRRKH